MATTSSGLSGEKPFIKSIEIIPMTDESIFSETATPPIETFNVTKNFFEWKSEFLNSVDPLFEATTSLDNADIINFFPELANFNYYMLSPTGLYKGITIEAKSTLVGSSISEVRSKLIDLMANNTNIVLYRLSSTISFNPETSTSNRSYKLRAGYIE